MRSAFRGSLDLEQKSSADNQVKRICACTSERTKIAIRQLTTGEFMQSIKDEIFVSNYSTNDSRIKIRQVRKRRYKKSIKRRNSQNFNLKKQQSIKLERRNRIFIRNLRSFWVVPKWSSPFYYPCISEADPQKAIEYYFKTIYTYR